MKFLYHFSRIVFGGWFLYSGLAHFLIAGWQPLGSHQPAIDFTLALMASGLFTWVKVIEVILGVTMLANRFMPLTVVALIPLNVVICYWNFVLDPGVVEYAFGIATIVFNAVLAWMWRGYFWQLFTFKGAPDYSLDPHLRG
jgi:hypothetical protein